MLNGKFSQPYSQYPVRAQASSLLYIFSRYSDNIFSTFVTIQISLQFVDPIPTILTQPLPLIHAPVHLPWWEGGGLGYFSLTLFINKYWPKPPMPVFTLNEMKYQVSRTTLEGQTKCLKCGCFSYYNTMKSTYNIPIFLKWDEKL